MQLLYNKNKDWNYLITLAGQMFPLKTNLDIVRILKSLNGSNAVAAVTKRRNLERWNHLPTPSIPVRLVKGGCHFAVTRCFVRYVLFDKRAHQFKKWTSKTSFPDEHYFQSLSHSPKLQVPGAYTGWPENGENGYEEMMRYVKWCYGGSECHGKFVRCVCIFGVADVPRMANSHKMFVNKFYYDYEPMALTCMEQRHYQWTRTRYTRDE
ncbi:hypothetical protein LSH36_1633g00022 [Paralvinella palmiformis]|uniref:Uncharacterized protein n=1 Tax=Paralvinella palmiformis TaxID=53620 RepID=A0AAD9IT31_9ANNE|nr:hypothetical protein LSH36_1633g00022 [Paralvinella palmiformis]